MAIAPVGALGTGDFKPKAQLESDKGRKAYRFLKNVAAVSAALETIAKRKGTTITSVA